MPINPEFEITLSITGRSYTDDYASLSSALVVLRGYEESFGQCLRIAAQRFSTEDERFPAPLIGLVSTSTGSLDVKTVLDVAAIAAPLAPQLPEVVRYGIELYKVACELVSIATKHFNLTQQPINVNINIENSPGARVASPILVIGNQGDVTINDENILTTARQIHKGLNTMAEQIGAGDVDTLKITAAGMENRPAFTALTMSEDNRYDYKVHSKDVFEARVRTAKCDVYSFNKKTGNGHLDILEESTARYYAFTGVDIDPALFVEALSAHYSTIFFTSKMDVNALGETKITKIFIQDITNHYEDPPVETEPDSTPPTIDDL